MHTVNPSNQDNYKIVECKNPLCNICTRTLDGTGLPPSPVSQGIVVYTCSNPSCSLCDGDYSLLLDIAYPILTPTEDCFLQEYNASGNLCNTKLNDELVVQERISTVRDEIQPKESKLRSTKRRLPNHLGYATKKRRLSANTKLFSDEVDSVDEMQLMNLAKELELDKVQCLPDLQNDVITELAQ